jgi:phosphoglycerate dehydrogenase-like enzyme
MKTKRASTRSSASRPATGRQRSAGKAHLHIENTSALGPIFETTERRLKDALARAPAVARRIHVTLGTDGDIFDREIATADALFAWSFDRKDLARRAPRLRWVHAHGAGVNHLLPLDWLPPGAVLTNSRGVHAERADEYVIMAILALNNRVPEMVTNQREGRWEQLFNTGVRGKTLLIVGVGSVGGRVAKLARGFGLRVVGVRRTGEPHPAVHEMHTPKDLAKLLPRADLVVVTAPHTPDTHHLLGEKEIALLRRGTGLVNYSRANLVDYAALRKRLDRREISAILDVFDPEPLPASSPLWRTPNLIITPHCSSDDAERYTPDTLDLVLRNMSRLLKGQPLLNVVRAELGY